MKKNTTTHLYTRMTAEERFRLGMAAQARGDEAEQKRLRETAPQVRLFTPDYTPYSQAFILLGATTFCDALDTGSTYLEELLLVDSAARSAEGPVKEGDAAGRPPTSRAKRRREASARAYAEERACGALALGYIFKFKVESWKCFCESLSLPPFAVWSWFAGFDRLQRALRAMEHRPITDEWMLHYLNERRPRGQPPCTGMACSPVDGARELDREFRRQIAQFGGE
jgi:hypothetical protein